MALWNFGLNTPFSWHPKQFVESWCAMILIGRGGRIGRAQAAQAEGREFESQPSQTIDIWNLYL